MGSSKDNLESGAAALPELYYPAIKSAFNDESAVGQGPLDVTGEVPSNRPVFGQQPIDSEGTAFSEEFSTDTVSSGTIASGELTTILPSPDVFTHGSGQRGSSRLSTEALYEVVKNYVEYYAHGESHTAHAKRYDLEYFLQFLAGSKEQVPLLSVSDWTVQKTKDFIDSRLARGEAPATVSRRLATIKHFGRTLAERVPGYINPAREVKGPVLQQTRPRGLNLDEVELLRQAAREQVVEKAGNFVAVRDRYLLELLLATGLRADEVRLLLFAQVSADMSWLKNVKTKGRRFRNVYLDSGIKEETERYFESREATLRDKSPGVFQLTPHEQGRIPVLISLYGSSPLKPESYGLSPKTVFNAIANIGKRAQGLAFPALPNLHPHKLRHTFAHGLLDSSKDVRLVAQALGHSDVRTTMRYTERSEQEVARAIEEKLAHERKRA